MSIKFGAAAFFETEGAAGITSVSSICASLGITGSGQMQAMLEVEEESRDSLWLLGEDSGGDPPPLDRVFR